MEHEWDPRQGMDRQCQPQRDFLAEATRLALQLDPVSWEFDLTDRNVDNASDVCNAQQMYFNNTALATVSGLINGGYLYLSFSPHGINMAMRLANALQSKTAITVSALSPSNPSSQPY